MQLINPKIKQSIYPLPNGHLTFGAHIIGVLGEPGTKKSLTAILNPANTETNDEEQVVNTYIYVDPVDRTVKQAPENHPWLTGASKSINLDSYPESLQPNIVASLNEVKGVFKKDGMRPISEEEFTEMLQNDPTLSALVPELIETFEVMMTEIEKEKKKYANVGVSDFIQRYAFRKHIMIMGPRGGGKTYTVSNYCEEQGYHTEFIAGHNGLESIDLLGYYIKDASGSLVWMDGPLTAAFRKAQTEKAVLFVDEILRIPVRELNILIGALTPDSTGHFTLRTNRIVGMEDGMGVSETLRVKAENLWVVSTTNIGADYDVEDMDLALKDRFRMIDMKVSANTVRSIIKSCNEGKFNDAILDRIMKVYTTVEALVQTKELTHTINVRYLCEILSICDDEADLVSFFFDLTPNVCSRTTDGDINEVEEKTYKHTIKSIFK